MRGRIVHEKKKMKVLYVDDPKQFFVAMMSDSWWANQTLIEATGWLMSNTGKVQPSADICSALTLRLIQSQEAQISVFVNRLWRFCLFV